MLNQFSRTELLIGKNGLEKLSKSRVAVFGIGGVGAYAVEALVRSGLGTIDIIDDDKVCILTDNYTQQEKLWGNTKLKSLKNAF